MNEQAHQSSLHVASMHATGYENVVLFANVTFGILETITSFKEVYPEFSPAIQLHFLLTEEHIDNWIAELIILAEQSEKVSAQSSTSKPLYSGLVKQHNKEIAAILEKEGLTKALQQKAKTIHTALRQLALT